MTNPKPDVFEALFDPLPEGWRERKGLPPQAGGDREKPAKQPRGLESAASAAKTAEANAAPPPRRPGAPESPWQLSRQSWIEVAKRTVQEFTADRVTSVAGGVTFFALLALSSRSAAAYAHRAEAVPLQRPPGAVPVVLHGLSFREPRAEACLLGDYRPPVSEAVNIGLMHTSLGGAPGHDPYAPVTPADLGRSGFDYWALGHIHKPSRQVVGRTQVVMPGIPQGRDIGEAGPRGVVLVTVAPDRWAGRTTRCVASAAASSGSPSGSMEIALPS